MPGIGTVVGAVVGGRLYYIAFFKNELSPFTPYHTKSSILFSAQIF